MRFSRFTIAAASILALAAPAAAQNNEAAPPSGNCQATPPPGANSGSNGGTGKPAEVDPGRTGSTSLSNRLDPCDGVLKPPPTGDSEMAQPPPSTGEMPIIKPGDLPPQQSNPQQQ
jgi:hypothetical protein